MSKYALSVAHLTVTYNESVALYDVHVDIPEGMLLGVIGPNGAGKTTFVRALLDLIPRTAGRIQFFGETYQAQCHRISYVPQRASIDWTFPLLVIDVVLMGAYQRIGLMKSVDKKEYVRAQEILELVGLADYAQRSIGSLSGGQQQRMLLARALMQDADMYIMDEPFVGVDAMTERFMAQLFRTLCARGKTMIVVHHNMYTIMEHFDWVLLLDVTRKAYGPAQQVLCDMFSMCRTAPYGTCTQPCTHQEHMR